MRRKTNITQLMLIAQDLSTKRQFNNAIKVLSQVIQLQPKNDQAYRLMGDAFDQLGQSQQAQKYYKLGIDCNPVSTICYVNYGLLLYNKGRKRQAQKMYQLCMEINPKDPTVLNNYTILLYELKKFDKAQQISKICLQVDPNNINCKQYLKKITQSKLQNKQRNSKRYMVKKQIAKANDYNNNEDSNCQQLLQLLLERDVKLVQKQTEIQKLRVLLQSKDQQIKYLKAQMQNHKKRRNEQDNLRLCKICLNKNALFINKKCGHLSSCKDCLKILKGNCPICRVAGSFIRIYSSMVKEELQV